MGLVRERSGRSHELSNFRACSIPGPQIEGSEAGKAEVPRRRPHRTAPSRTKRQNPLPPFRLQRVLRRLRQLPKLARGTRPRKNQAALAMDGRAAVKWRGQGANDLRIAW